MTALCPRYARAGAEESPRLPEPRVERAQHEENLQQGDAFAQYTMEYLRGLGPLDPAVHPSMLQRLQKAGANLPSSVLEPQLDSTGLARAASPPATAPPPALCLRPAGAAPLR